MSKANSLIDLINPQPNSVIMIYDVHASESGALSILNDLYYQINLYQDKTIKWIFVISVPTFEEKENIIVKRFPWVKKNWAYRYYFEVVTTRCLLMEFKPDKIFSLQNKGISFFKKEQLVYLHLPFILTDHKFNLKTDGSKIWLYQNVISKSVFKSLRRVNVVIVQTNWMKQALIKKGKIMPERIFIQKPDISGNNVIKYVDTPESRKRFFYPATAFYYKNHITLLKALDYAQKKGMKDYEMIFTITGQENRYSRKLSKFVCEHKLNVQFRGEISRRQVFEIYAKSILIFPSYVESFGLPLLEARISNTFIIASDCSFSREILKGYEKAYYFPKLDYKCLANKLQMVMESKGNE